MHFTTVPLEAVAALLPELREAEQRANRRLKAAQDQLRNGVVGAEGEYWRCSGEWQARHLDLCCAEAKLEEAK